MSASCGWMVFLKLGSPDTSWEKQVRTLSKETVPPEISCGACDVCLFSLNIALDLFAK